MGGVTVFRSGCRRCYRRPVACVVRSTSPYWSMSLRASHRAVGDALAFVVIASGCDARAGADAQATAVSPPSRPFVVVANQRSGVATLVEVASGRVSHVELGLKPHEVAVSPDTRIAVLTIPSERFSSSSKAVVLDLATGKISRTVDLGAYKGPHGVAFLSDSVALIGTLSGTSAVYADVRNGRVLRSVDGLPENPYVVKLTATGRAYVSSPHSSKVTEIDVAAARVTRTIDIPDDPAGIAVSADGKELYAAVWRENAGGGIAIFDLDKGVVSAKLPATQPRRMTVTADGKLVVVSDRDQLRIVDRATRQMRSVPLGQNAGGSGVACSPDSMRCYVALSQAGEVVEVDVSAAKVLRRFAAQKGVDGVAYVAP
jgi:DNA-binding beta-propeller fold protein YncE